jgi:hypothetical protein
MDKVLYIHSSGGSLEKENPGALRKSRSRIAMLVKDLTKILRRYEISKVLQKVL